MRGRAARVIRSALALALLAGGCEVLIDGKLHAVRCLDEGTVGPPACPTGFECKDALCVPTALGSPCVSDEDCSAGDLCLDPARLGEGGAPRCSRACCGSADCDPDDRFVCWHLASGAGGFCRAATELGRDAAGSGKPGAACAHGGDCRSGICDGARCADTCCSDTACAAGGEACRFTGEAFWCALPAVEKKPRYATCASHAECASGLCIALAPDPAPRCSVPCCSSPECEVSPEKGLPVACAPVLVEKVMIRACSALVLGKASGAVGSACAADGDCRSGRCEPATQRCTDACCDDDSCGDPSSFVCRPAGEPWALRCAAK